MMVIKILSIRQAWAHHIVHGDKDIENRSWKTSYRGAALIQASLKRSDTSPPIPPHAPPMQFGGIIGVVEIVDCVTTHPSPWFEGPFGFLLNNRRALPFVPWPGALSLRDAPQELIERIGEFNLREYLSS